MYPNLDFWFENKPSGNPALLCCNGRKLAKFFQLVIRHKVDEYVFCAEKRMKKKTEDFPGISVQSLKAKSFKKNSSYSFQRFFVNLTHYLIFGSFLLFGLFVF
jgi:hypothetical protein